MGREAELRTALRRMCEYANYLGNKVLPELGNGNYAGDFVKQYGSLLEEGGDDIAVRLARALKAIEDAVVASLFKKLPDGHAHLLQVIDREKVVLREYEEMSKTKPVEES